MSDILKITLVQADIVWEDIEKNLENYTRKLTQIGESTDLIVLPEMFATGFLMNPRQFAENPNGKIFNWMKTISARKSAALIGSIITTENGKFYNRLIWMNPDGEFFQYDKRHLFTFAGEDKNYTGGNSKLIINYKGWRIRPLICYDLRFPVWSRNRNDYDLLIYTANWPERRNHAWKSLLTARAIENQCYTAGLNRIGKDGDGVGHSGDSALLDAFGKQISNIKPNEEATATFGISFSELNDFRNKFAFWKDADDFEII
jgi:predicted amidohydrolase